MALGRSASWTRETMVRMARCLPSSLRCMGSVPPHRLPVRPSSKLRTLVRCALTRVTGPTTECVMRMRETVRQAPTAATVARML